MKNLKVVQYLHSMTPTELEGFEDYVRSPYFNKRKESIELFEFLRKYYPDYPEEAIQKELVFQAIFPSQPYDEKKIYNQGIYLQKLILQFWALEKMKRYEDLWEAIHQIYALEERKFYKHAAKIYQSLEQTFEQPGIQDPRYFYFKYLFTEQKVNRILKAQNRAPLVPLETIAEQLDEFVLISKLEIAIPFANMKNIVEGGRDQQLIQETKDLYTKIPEPKTASIRLYYCALMMLLEKQGESYFEELIEHLGQKPAILPPGKQYQLYLYGINYCSRMIKFGKDEFVEKTFEIFQQMLEQQILFLHAHTTNLNFKNTVTIGLRLKKYNWVKKFINSYQDNLSPLHKQSIISYSMASLHFSKGEYSQAQQMLMGMQFADPYYRLSNDILLLKIFYEKGETETLYFRCRALLTFISRNKILADANKIAYSNFARMVRKIARIKYERKKSRPQIIEEFESSQYLVERKWLGEKIEELDKK